MNVPEIVKAEIAPALGLPSAGLTITPRPPLEIQSNRLYDVWAGSLHFIAKEYLQANELVSAPLREFKALRLLSPLDIAPQPVFFDPSLGPLVVYEYMPGEMWDRRRPSRADLSRLMETWLKIQAVPADWLSRGSERSLQEVELEIQLHLRAYLDWTAAEFPAGRQAAEMSLDRLEQRHAVFQELSEIEPFLCFCRSDPRFANVIQRPNGQLGLVDWEDCGLRDPAREAADLLTHPNQEDRLTWKAWQVFVEPYLEIHSRKDPGAARKLHLYLAVFPLFWLANLVKRGLMFASSEKLMNWNINALPANDRLRRYLARALAWPDMQYADTLHRIKRVQFFPDRNQSP